LVKFLVWQIHYWSHAQVIFLANFAGQGVVSKDLTVLLDSKPPSMSQIISSTN
jgi:hypothetical protein